MADIDLGASVSLDDASVAAISAALTKAMENGLKPMTKIFDSLGKKAASNVGSAFAKTNTDAQRLTKSAKELQDTLAGIERQSLGVSKNLGKSFDPRSLALVEDQLAKIADLQKEVTANSGNLSKSDQSQLRSQLRGVEASLKLVQTAFQQSARAAIEADKSMGQSARQTGRERIAAINAERSANVVATQRAAATELATIRANSAAEVADTRATARTRAALFELAGRSIVATERTIRAAFQSTASVVSSAFRGIGNAATAALSKTSSIIHNSNKSIENSYATAFSNSTKSVRNELSQQTTAVRSFVSNTTNQLNSLSTAAGGIGGGVKTGIGVALGGLLGIGAAKALSSGFTRAANLEDAQRAFTVLLKDAEKAKLLTDQILQVVTGTPFRLDQFSQAASQLLAFNVAAEDIPRILTAIGDAAAVQGGQAGEFVDRLVRTFGQIQTAGKVTTEDLNQIAEAGVPAFAILGNALNVTTGDLREMITEGLVPSDVAINALVAGIENGSDGINGLTSSVGGLAQSLGTTLRGSLANFNTAIARLGAGIITTFGPLLIKGLSAATAAIDLLGSALKSLATAITQNFVVKALGDAFGKLGEQIKKAQTALKPVFDFLSQGAVIVGTIVVAFQALQFVPAVLSAIAAGFAAILSPMTLFIGAAVVVASFLKNLIDGSTALQTALAVVGRSISAALVPAVEAFRSVLSAVGGVFSVFTSNIDSVSESGRSFAESIGDFLIEKLTTLSAFINTTVAPAIQRLADFIESRVVPAIERFGNFIQDRVLPAISDFADRAGELASGALRTAVAYIQGTVIPVVGEALSTALEFGAKGVKIAQGVWDDFYAFASGTLVPFIQSNLIPVLGTLAAVIGTLALTGNLPLAGLVGAAAGIGLALSNESIRNALVDNIKQGIDKARDALGNLVDSGTLGKIAGNVLKVANKVGEIIGKIASDRRLLTAIAAIGAAGVALAVALIAGFAKGVASNIPDLADALADGLGLAFDAALAALISNPKIAIGLVAVIAGAAAINSFRKAGELAGKAVAQGMVTGATPTPGSVGLGGGTKDFVSALFGSPASIKASIIKQTDQVASVLETEARRLNRVLGTATGSGARQVGTSLFASPKDIKAATTSIAEFTNRAGPAVAAAAFFKTGLKDIGAAVKTVDLTRLSDGVKNIGQAFKLAGPQIAQAAGATIGGALATSIVSSALFNMKSSGIDKLQAGLGVVGTGLAVGAVAGPEAAAAAVGIGLVTAAFQANAQRAKDADTAARGYAGALDQVTTAAERTAAVSDTFLQHILGQGGGVRDALARIGFKYKDFVAAVESGDAEGALEGVNRALLDSETTIGTVRSTMTFLNDEVNAIDSGGKLTEFKDNMQGAADVDFSPLINQIRSMAGFQEQLATATDAAKQAMEQVKDVAVDELSGRVDSLRGRMEDLTSATEHTRDTIFDLLRGPSEGDALNQAIVDAASTTEAINSQFAEGGDSAGTAFNAGLALKLSDAKAQIAGLLSDDTSILTKADAEAKLQPLIDAAIEQGGEGAFKYVDAANQVLANWTPQVDLARASQTATEDAIPLIQAALDDANVDLSAAVNTDASQFDGAKEAARTAFEGIARDATAGFAEGLGEDGSAATTWADAQVAAAESALGISSPSTVFAAMGGFAVQGFAQGISSGTPQAVSAIMGLTRAIIVPFQALRITMSLFGAFATQGLADGILARKGAAVAAAQAVANAVSATMAKALEVESPSKVTMRIGENTSEGLAVGVRNAAPAVVEAARVAGIDLAKGFVSGIKESGEIVSSGVDIFEDGVTTRFHSLGQTLGEAIGFGLAESGPSIIGSIDGIINEITLNSLDKTDQLKLVGGAIASSLFGAMGKPGFGGETAGGTAVAELQRQFLSLPDKLTEGFRSNFAKFGAATPTFNVGSEAGRANRDAFLSGGIAIRDYTQALIDAGRPLDSVIWETQQWRDQLIAGARAQGATNEEIDQMVAQLGLSDGQLASFAANVNAVAAATEAGNLAAEQALKAQRAAIELTKAEAKAKEEAADAAKKAQDEEDAAAKKKKDAEDAAEREIESRPPPIFRDMILNLPTGDPEANALAVANRIAFSASRG